MDNDENARGNYLRDYTNEPIRTGPTSSRPAQPQPVTEPVPEPVAEPQVNHPPEPEQEIELPGYKLPAPPTTHHGHKARKRSYRKYLSVFILLIACLAVGAGMAYYQTRKNSNHASNQSSGRFPASVTSQISTPLYYPVSLPAGYKVNNDFNVIKPGILYYSINDPSNNVYLVTIKPISVTSDPAAFEKNFTIPDVFSTDAGTATVGLIGSSLMASIHTKQNVWILVAPKSTEVLTQLETIAQAFQQSK